MPTAAPPDATATGPPLPATGWLVKPGAARYSGPTLPSPSSRSPECLLSTPPDCLWPPDGRCIGLRRRRPSVSPTARVWPPSCAYLEEGRRAESPQPAPGAAAEAGARPAPGGSAGAGPDSASRAAPLPKKGSWPSCLRRLSTTGWPKVMFGTKCLGAQERDPPARRLLPAGPGGAGHPPARSLGAAARRDPGPAPPAPGCYPSITSRWR